MNTAQSIIEQLKSELKTLASIDGANGKTFTVRGWPFAILRNGPSWDLLSKEGLSECLKPEGIIAEIVEIVLQTEADNGGWDFDPSEIEI